MSRAASPALEVSPHEALEMMFSEAPKLVVVDEAPRMYPDQNGAYAADWWPLFWTRLKELQGQFTDKTDVRVLVLATYTVLTKRVLLLA